jgi:hypothetical protein
VSSPFQNKIKMVAFSYHENNPFSQAKYFYKCWTSLCGKWLFCAVQINNSPDVFSVFIFKHFMRNFHWQKNWLAHSPILYVGKPTVAVLLCSNSFHTGTLLTVLLPWEQVLTCTVGKLGLLWSWVFYSILSWRGNKVTKAL